MKGGTMSTKRFRILPSTLILMMLVSVSVFSQATQYGPAKGTLLIIGGGTLDGSGINEKFIELAGGPNSKFVIVPTAGGNKDSDGSIRVYKEEDVLKPFRALGLKNLV